MHQFLLYANRFRRLYTQLFQPLARAHDLTQLEIDILLFLANNPETNTARDIVQMRGFAKSNVSQALSALEKKGLTRSASDPGSRKMRRLFLTPQGQAVAYKLVKRQQRCFALLLAGFSAEERKQMEYFWQRMDRNLCAAVHHIETAKKEQ